MFRNQCRRLLLHRCKPAVFNLQHKVYIHSLTPHHHLYHTSLNIPTSLQTHFQSPNLTRLFSSSSDQNKPLNSQSVVTLIQLYSDPFKTNEDIIQELLKSKNDLASGDHGDLIEFFKTRGSDQPGSARNFYAWVIINEEMENLSSISCNKLLGMLGGNGLVKEFWDLVDVMNKKEYKVKKGVWVRAMAKFEEEEGLEVDVKKLKGLIAFDSLDPSVEKVSYRVYKVIRQGPWRDDVETKLKEMGVVYTRYLVKSVLENLATELDKAVLFFRWVEESGLYKHDEMSYDAIVRELARQDYMDKCWKLINEMRAAGFELHRITHLIAKNGFVRKKMLKEAVDLYEFAMGGTVKPTLLECTCFLETIVTSDKLDMDLFSKVLRIYKEGGNRLKDIALDGVLKTLTSVGRFNEHNKILRAVEEVGFFLDENSQSKIAFQLSKNSKTGEASEFLDFMEAFETIPCYTTLESMIEEYCISGHLDKACDCFQKLIENEGRLYDGSSLETLTEAYCYKESAIEAYKLLSEAVIEKDVEPWHITYELLISKLLDQGLFEEATDLFAPMKAHGYPPYLDPFVKYVSEIETTDETGMSLKAMTNKKELSTAVYMRVFTAYFTDGRHNEAQDFLSICPRYIQDHVDVLNLFSSMKRA